LPSAGPGLPAFPATAAGAYLHGLAAVLASDLKSGAPGQRALLPKMFSGRFGRAFAAAGWDE
jgi:hypothetical protein